VLFAEERVCARALPQQGPGELGALTTSMNDKWRWIGCWKRVD